MFVTIKESNDLQRSLNFQKPENLFRSKQMTNSTDALNKQLFQELDDKAAENCNGGLKVFTVKNQVKGITVGFRLDGRNVRLRPGKGHVWTTRRRGIITFDRDTRKSVTDWKGNSLADGGVYAFRRNGRTRGNPYDIGIYRIG
jgi:hypothetical protein